MKKGLFGSVPGYFKEEKYRMSYQRVHDYGEIAQIDGWMLVQLEKNVWGVVTFFVLL